MGRITPYGASTFLGGHDPDGELPLFSNPFGIFRVIAFAVMNQPAGGATVTVNLNGDPMHLVAEYDTVPDGSGSFRHHAGSGDPRPAARVAVYEYESPYPEPSTLTASISDGSVNGWCVEAYIVNSVTNSAEPGSVINDIQFMTGYGDRFGDGETRTLELLPSGGRVFWFVGGGPSINVEGENLSQVPPDGTSITVEALTPHVDETDTGDPLIGFALVDTTSSLGNRRVASRLGMYRPNGGGPEVFTGGTTGALTYETGHECYYSWPSPYAAPGTFTIEPATAAFSETVKIGTLYEAFVDRKVTGVIIWVADNIEIASAGIVRAPDSPAIFTDFTPTDVYTFDPPPGGFVSGSNVLTIPEIDQFMWLAGQRLVFWYELPNDVSYVRQESASIFVPIGAGISVGISGPITPFAQVPSMDPVDWFAIDYGISVVDQAYPIYPILCAEFGPDYIQTGGVGVSFFPATDEAGIQWLPGPTPLNYDAFAFSGMSFDQLVAADPLAPPYTGWLIPGQYGDNFAWDYGVDDIPLPLLGRRLEVTSENDGFVHYLYGSPVANAPFLWPVAFEILDNVPDRGTGTLQGRPDDDGSQPWYFDTHGPPIWFAPTRGGTQGLLGRLKTDLSIGIPPPSWSVGFTPNIGYEEVGVDVPTQSYYSAFIPPGTTALPFPRGSWGFFHFDTDEFVVSGVTWFIIGISFKANIIAGGTRPQVQIIG